MFVKSRETRCFDLLHRLLHSFGWLFNILLESTWISRINDGTGLVAHGLEFSLAILRESLVRLEAQGIDGVKPNDLPSDACSKKRKCGETCQAKGDCEVIVA